MSKALPLTDFRAVRVVLEPEEFAMGPKTERPPSDIIDKDSWHGIMNLPDDVAIRTSNHNGSTIRDVYALSGAWLESIGEDNDSLSETMIDTIDEFQSITFNSLHGFYRQAIASLRNALELVAVGAYCQTCNKQHEFSKWRKGQIEIPFGSSCDGLDRTVATKSLNSFLIETVNDSITGRKSTNSPGGWARRLYSELSDYTHSRPTFTNADLWASNGPDL